jgi:hypothetical protein
MLAMRPEERCCRERCRRRSAGAQQGSDASGDVLVELDLQRSSARGAAIRSAGPIDDAVVLPELSHVTVARPDAVTDGDFTPGRYLIVGKDDADPKVARIASVAADGNIELEVLRGSVESHHDVLTTA